MTKEFVNRTGLFAFIALVITMTNVFGYKHTFSETIGGVLILVAIGYLGVTISAFMKKYIKLPTMFYVSLLGILAACPISPVASVVIEQNNNIAFLAPCLVMTSFAGISLGKDIKSFLKMGWKMIIITVFVIAGTYLGSVMVAHFVLKFMGY